MRRPSKGPRGTTDKTGQATRERIRRELVRRHGAICWRCHGVIDLALRWPHPRAFTRGHLVPRAAGGSDALDNQRPEHNECNYRAGRLYRHMWVAVVTIATYHPAPDACASLSRLAALSCGERVRGL